MQKFPLYHSKWLTTVALTYGNNSVCENRIHHTEVNLRTIISLVLPFSPLVERVSKSLIGRLVGQLTE
jgi:hypothetical protein